MKEWTIAREVETRYFWRIARETRLLIRSQDQIAVADALSDLEMIAEMGHSATIRRAAFSELRHLAKAGQGGVIDVLARRAIANLDFSRVLRDRTPVE